MTSNKAAGYFKKENDDKNIDLNREEEKEVN